jgi:hypothetical protein
MRRVDVVIDTRKEQRVTDLFVDHTLWDRLL